MNDEKHGHIHHGRSSRSILSADKVLKVAGLKNGDVFLDAGCGDGFISIVASSFVGEEGKVYAVDVYPESIELVKEEVQNKGLKNVDAIIADLTRELPLTEDSVDLCVMANVLHGFVENNEVDKVFPLIRRVIKNDGKFVVVEFKKLEGIPGPPFNIKLNPYEVERLLLNYRFKIDEAVDIGEYHYLVKAVKSDE